MKQILLLFLASVLVCACKKNNSNTNATPGSGQVTYPNSITVTDNGKTMTISSIPSYNSAKQASDKFVDAFVYKFTGYSQIEYGAYTPNTSNIEFELHFDTKGPANALGTFDVVDGVYKELHNGGLTYNIVGGTANVTSSASSNLSGTMILKLQSGTTTKTINGIFKYEEPLF